MANQNLKEIKEDLSVVHRILRRVEQNVPDADKDGKRSAKELREHTEKVQEDFRKKGA